MAQKNFLKELLKEAQEPFQLRDYIADRKCELQKQSSLREPRANIAADAQRQQSQLVENPKKPMSTGRTKSLRTNFCKNGCFFSSYFHESPDFSKSPLFEFPSPLQANGYKSPCRGGSKSNPLFLHVPAKTAALLLEAAMRIQQKQSNPRSKSSKSHLKSSGFRLFGSVIKRLTNRRRGSSISTSNGADGDELVNNNNNNEIVRWAAGRTNLSRDEVEEQQNSNKSLELRSCSTSTGTRTSTTTCCSSSSSSSSSGSVGGSVSCCRFEDDEDEENNEFVNVLDREIDDNYDIGLCPVSPFRFALYKSPSPDHHQHHCNRRSPAKSSPTRRKFEDNVNCENSVKFQGEEEEDEEDKEQNSPVSILDPPFEDDDQGLDDDDDDDHEDGYDLDCGYAFVQRTKQQLLHKLRRFEKLAELDPLELEQKLAEERGDRYDDEQGLELNEGQQEGESGNNGRDMNRFAREVIAESCFGEIQKPGMKRLLSDIITYEEQVTDENCCDDPEETLALVKRVRRRLDSWKQVESNTIDMMAEMDLRREGGAWKNHSEQIGETAWEIEVHIFAVLVDELTGELVC